MKEERSPIELLLDENNSDNIKLFDDKNNEVEFEQVAIVPIDEKIYAILKPAQKMEGVGDDEALVFGIEEIGDLWYDGKIILSGCLCNNFHSKSAGMYRRKETLQSGSG